MMQMILRYTFFVFLLLAIACLLIGFFSATIILGCINILIAYAYFKDTDLCTKKCKEICEAGCPCLRT